MNRPNRTHPSWWQRLRPRDRTPPGPDPADMGTCFGLDASLDDGAPLPGLGTPAEPRGGGWLARLGARAKPAA